MLLHDAFDFHACGRGDYCFARCEGRSYSYREARALSLQLAHALVHAGVKAGDRIGLLQRNSIEGLLLIFAVSRIGAVLLPLNYRLSPQEWIDLAVDAEASVFIADYEYAHQLNELDAEVRLPDDLLKICIGTCSGWESYSKLEEFPQISGDLQAPSGSDIVFHMYTSGTTGKPKGALLSHRAIVENIAKSSCTVCYRLNPGERSLVVLPLFHIAAISTTLCAVAQGACLIIHRDVDPVAIANALAADEIVVVSLVPAVIQFLLTGVPGIESMTFPKLRYLGYGASPIAEPVLRRAMDVFKCDFGQGFGMTEIGGPATFLTEIDHRRALHSNPGLLLSAGRAFPGIEIRIVSSRGQILPPGEIGEILLRGGEGEFLTGYWKQPEASDAVLDGGWLHTGDAGYLDEDGYLYIRDRVKDMIVTGAENVYPVEIESVLFDHPAVGDASVIGVPDERWGEAVMAVIVLKQGEAVSPAELDRFCRKRLGGFKVPRRYEFVTDLPRNASGKVLKRELRDKYWQGQERRVG